MAIRARVRWWSQCRLPIAVDMVDHELDDAIVSMLAVRRAEYRAGFTMHRGFTASDIAVRTGQPLERVELRLVELESAGRVASPTGASDEWTRTG